jgi:maleate isomerase
MYGWRGRIGLIVPSTNTVNEPDFYRHLPEGVSVHTARMRLDQEDHRENEDLSELERMTADADRAAELLSTASVDVLAYGCTSGSFMHGEGYGETLAAELESATGVPAVTTAAAVRRALETLDVGSMAIASPYTDDVLNRALDFFEQCGYDVVDAVGKGIDVVGSALDERSHGAQTPERAYRQVTSMNYADADAVFISCTNYHVTDAIPKIEADTNTPVVTSNQATLWAALRELDVATSGVRLGRLFEP